MACKHKGSRGIVGRRTYRSLKDTTWHILRSMIPRELIEKEHEQNLYLRLTNGSEILGYHLTNMETLAGFELDWFYLDEAQEIEEEVFLQLCGRLSSPLGCNKGWISGTPRGKNWIWKRFVSEQRANHEVIRVTSYENPYLTAEYIEDLKQTYDDEWIARFLRGDWDIYEGQVFEMFSPDIHLIDHFPIPSHWPRFRSVDHGIRVPTACLWATLNEQGDLFVTQEYYEANRDADQNAKAILERSKFFENRVAWTVGDPSMARREGTGESVSDLYRKAGLTIIPGKNAIKPSIAELRRLFRVDPQHLHPITGEKGSPRLFIFRGCDNLVWEIGQYVWPDLKKDGTGDDKPAQSPDHCLIAGTLVQTPEGAIPIEQVEAGMQVCTRDGPREVLAAGLTSPAARVYRVDFSNGAHLVGTAGHPVWSVDRQKFVPIDALRYLGNVEVWNNRARKGLSPERALPSHCQPLRSSITKGSSFGATPTPRVRPIGITTHPGLRIMREAWNAFTARCGKIRSALFPRTARSTTGTSTRSTMIPRILSASPSRSTSSATAAGRSASDSDATSKRSSRAFKPTSESGREATKAGALCRNGQRSSGQRQNPSREPVSSAERPTSAQDWAFLSSAPTTARAPGDALPASITRTEAALFAASSLPPTSTSPPNAAVAHVVRLSDAGIAPVYNLTVAGTPEFYANGVLVHNCLDSLRYLVQQRPQSAVTIKTGGTIWEYVELEEARSREKNSDLRPLHSDLAALS